jgi:hypothetical protein
MKEGEQAGMPGAQRTGQDLRRHPVELLSECLPIWEDDIVWLPADAIGERRGSGD